MTTQGEVSVADVPLKTVPRFSLGLQDEGNGNLALGRFETLTTNPGLVYATRAALYADLARGPNTQAWVWGDTTTAYNGVYMKTGASGTGGWTRMGDLPVPVIFATDTGAGEPDAIVATSWYPISGSALVVMQVFETNTGSPVTVRFNGADPVTIKTAAGNNPATGGLPAGMWLIGIVSGSTYRLFSEQSSAAVLAAAEAAQTAAEAARDAAEAFAGAAQSVSDAFARPASRAALKALNTAAVNTAYLTESDRANAYVWRFGDYAAAVAADTDERSVIKADAIAAGTGAWVLQTESAPRVGSRTVMKMMSPAATTAVLLLEKGRYGLFVWRFGDFSGLVAADPNEGVYVPSASVSSSVGCWVRLYEYMPDITWFGAIGDVIRTSYTVTATVGSPNITLTGAAFTSADVGKPIMIEGIGTAAAPLTTTISNVTDGTHIVLAANAATAATAVSKQVIYGTDAAGAVQAALNLAAARGGGVIRIPGSDFALNSNILVAAGCGIDGIDKNASRLYLFGSTGQFAFQFGANPSDSLNYYMRASNMEIFVCCKGRNVLDVFSPCMSHFEDLSIGGVLVKLSPICIRVNGSNASGFFTTFDNVLCNHVYYGFYIHTTGTQELTQLLFRNCTVYGDVNHGEATSVGMYFANCGDASNIIGGNMEYCGTGIHLYNGTQRVTMLGVRFEGNTTDYAASGNSDYNQLIGCYALENISDTSTYKSYIGCSGTAIGTGIINSAVYLATSAAGANMVVSSTGAFLRSTSARKYKTDVRRIADEMLDALMQLDGITYRSICAGDDPTARHIGIVADQAADVGLHELVMYGPDGEPEGFAYDRMVALLLEETKRLAGRVAALEKRH